MPKTYFDGMIAAYRDAAQFVEHLKNNLPPEVSFMASAFDPLIEGFNNKANEVIKQFVWGDFPQKD